MCHGCQYESMLLDTVLGHFNPFKLHTSHLSSVRYIAVVQLVKSLLWKLEMMLALRQKGLFDIRYNPLQSLRVQKENKTWVTCAVYSNEQATNSLIWSHSCTVPCELGYGTILYTSATPGGARLHAAQTLWWCRSTLHWSIFLLGLFNIFNCWPYQMEEVIAYFK